MKLLEITEAVKKAKRVYIIGNGGSYANAIHICNDLLSVGIKAYTLDPASLTALANDHGYENAFAKWLKIVADADDLLIALSGSGTSPNIMQAIATAEIIGMDWEIVTNFLREKNMQESEEEQLVIGHQVMKEIRGNG